MFSIRLDVSLKQQEEIEVMLGILNNVTSTLKYCAVGSGITGETDRRKQSISWYIVENKTKHKTKQKVRLKEVCGYLKKIMGK